MADINWTITNRQPADRGLPTSYDLIWYKYVTNEDTAERVRIFDSVVRVTKPDLQIRIARLQDALQQARDQIQAARDLDTAAG